MPEAFRDRRTSSATIPQPRQHGEIGSGVVSGPRQPAEAFDAGATQKAEAVLAFHGDER